MKQDPGQDQPAPAGPLVPQVDGQLVEFGPGDQVGGAHQVHEPLVVDPAAPPDQLRRASSRCGAAGPPKAHHARAARKTARPPRGRAGPDPVTTASCRARPRGPRHRRGWQDHRHAWNQPHPGRGRHPRRPPGRHVVLHRPGPHDRRRRTFGSTTTIEFTCTRARAPRPSPTWSARPSTRSPSTASPSTPSAYADNRIALTGLAAENTLVVRGRLHLLPHRRGAAPLRRPRRRPGLPLLPVRGARRPPRLHDLRAARPQGAVHVHRDRARALEGRLQRRQPRSPRTSGDGQGGLAVPGDQADVDLHHRAGRRRVPRGHLHLRRQDPGDPARPLLPPVAGRAPRRRRAHQGHRAGLRVLRGGLRLPLPVRQVRPAVRAGVQHGRDGERRRASPSATSTSRAAARTARSTSSAPR